MGQRSESCVTCAWRTKGLYQARGHYENIRAMFLNVELTGVELHRWRRLRGWISRVPVRPNPTPVADPTVQPNFGIFRDHTTGPELGVCFRAPPRVNGEHSWVGAHRGLFSSESQLPAIILRGLFRIDWRMIVRRAHTGPPAGCASPYDARNCPSDELVRGRAWKPRVCFPTSFHHAASNLTKQ